MSNYIPVLTIAGSDSSGGAGIQADLKTMSAIGCYAMSAITAITAQNTLGVDAIEGISPEMVMAQVNAVYADIRPRAVKTGMLYSDGIVRAVAESLSRNGVENLVVDPVMMSTSGSLLIDRDAIKTIVDKLFPLAELITPNKAEAKALTGYDNVDCQAETFHMMGAKAVLLKGGDSDRTDVKIDYLSIQGRIGMIELSSPAVDTVNTHGTGCTLSSAIASYLALGFDLVKAIRLAKKYITKALEAGAAVSIGAGHGPVNHLFNPHKLIIEE